MLSADPAVPGTSRPALPVVACLVRVGAVGVEPVNVMYGPLPRSKLPLLPPPGAETALAYISDEASPPTADFQFDDRASYLLDM